MRRDFKLDVSAEEANGRTYSAPALEKGLDILEALCRSQHPLTQKDLAGQVGRSVGEIYRMIQCLVTRNYVAQVDDSYAVTTKLFELSHLNPPTHRLLIEATPIMNRLASEFDQSCHLTVYNHGKQVVIAKVDSPSGMGFSLRVGSDLDVLISVSGRVLVAFQDDETRRLRVAESLQRIPDRADPQIDVVLDYIRARGYESSPSSQVRGLYAVSFPVLDSRNHATAALTIPYAERIDQAERRPIVEIQEALSEAAKTISMRIGGWKETSTASGDTT
ncbi:IclR family transcriptional regulator [Pandoraea sp. XJJ-1]|uniref:IclR family transcriptional regulator n=1 Tax=Pandoraea sp. XJJ-1 TaxID=3002643 RepID=UPI00227FE614|nr:IclR family transcriptional regulator [Pandoraea sp. XJJ-1]WAL84008.1 IclR family transcriptional regulator [Pandoraea sp. XJJ-1]